MNRYFHWVIRKLSLLFSFLGCTFWRIGSLLTDTMHFVLLLWYLFLFLTAVIAKNMCNIWTTTPLHWPDPAPTPTTNPYTCVCAANTFFPELPGDDCANIKCLSYNTPTLEEIYKKEKYLNCPPWLEKILNYASLKCVEKYLNRPPWLGENFEICWPQMATKEKYLNCPPIIGEHFEIC